MSSCSICSPSSSNPQCINVNCNCYPKVESQKPVPPRKDTKLLDAINKLRKKVNTKKEPEPEKPKVPEPEPEKPKVPEPAKPKEPEPEPIREFKIQ